MPGNLVIVNTDAAAGAIKRARPDDAVLAWFDPLFMGPVPAGLELEALSSRRAEHIARQPWGFSRLGLSHYQARDAMIRRHTEFDDVTLAFQPNMLDQLQLLQVLDSFSGLSRAAGSLRLAQIPRFIDELGPSDIDVHLMRAKPVSDEQLAIAVHAFEAYRQPTPEAFAELLQFDLGALPNLEAAVVRALEELPAPGTGLTRSERQILEIVRRGHLEPRALYSAHFALEDSPYLDDWCFYAILDSLADGAWPLVEGKADIFFNANMSLTDWRRYVIKELGLSNVGFYALRAFADATANVAVEHWWGGTYLTSDNLWRWDPEIRTLVPPARAGRSVAATATAETAA